MQIKTILVPFDFGEPSHRALAHAEALAERFGAVVHLLHVVPNPFLAGYIPGSADVAFPLPPDVIDGLLKDAEARLGRVLAAPEHQAFRARAFVTSGDPRTEVLEHAAREHADLIVMGTHGRTGVGHVVLGSVAERVVRAAPCPVLTVH